LSPRGRPRVTYYYYHIFGGGFPHAPDFRSTRRARSDRTRTLLISLSLFFPFFRPTSRPSDYLSVTSLTVRARTCAYGVVGERGRGKEMRLFPHANRYVRPSINYYRTRPGVSFGTQSDRLSRAATRNQRGEKKPPPVKTSEIHSNSISFCDVVFLRKCVKTVLKKLASGVETQCP